MNGLIPLETERMNKTKLACKTLKGALEKLTGKRVKQLSCYERSEYESFAKFVVNLRDIDLDKMVDEMQSALKEIENYMDVLLFNDDEIEKLDENAMKRAPVEFCILWYTTMGE